MTTATLMKQIWALPEVERAKIYAALKKEKAEEDFYQKEGMTRAEFRKMIKKSRSSSENSPEETRHFLQEQRAKYKASA